MTEKFKNKYRTASHRKPQWDYSANALYFLTLVTQHRECNLGKIIHGKEQPFMQLSEFGKIVDQEWFKSFEIRSELFLHEFVIMPNHLHTIVEIYHDNRGELMGVDTNGAGGGGGGFGGGGFGGGGFDGGGFDVETHGRVSLPAQPAQPAQPADFKIAIEFNETTETELLSIKRNPPKRLPKSISSFIAGFKSAVNTKIDNYIDDYQLNIPKFNKKNHFFQPNYHDHIIRNYLEYIIISNYIIKNPENWKKDTFHGNH